MNTNTKMIIHLLVTTIAPFVVWGLLYLSEARTNGRFSELASTLQAGFIRIAIGYLTGIIYLVLLILWFYKYRSVSLGVKLLPLLPLVVFIVVRLAGNWLFEYRNRTYSAQTFLEEYASEFDESDYEEREDGQKAVRVDSYLSELCLKYSIVQTNYSIPTDRMEEIVADSLPVIMERLEKEELCEPAPDSKEKGGAYVAITIETWSYDPDVHQLSVTYSTHPEPIVYDVISGV